MPEAVRQAFRLPSLLLRAIILWGGSVSPYFAHGYSAFS